MIMTVTAGVVGGLNGNQICNEFVEGTKSLLWVGLVMGLCKGVTNILTEANIIDTIIMPWQACFTAFPYSCRLCYVCRPGCNQFRNSSGSGQAAVTMPLMIPLETCWG